MIKKTAKKIFTNGRVIALISAIVLASSAVLPWASTERASVSGIEGDGIFTISIGIIAMIFLFIRKIPVIFSIFLGAVAVIVAISNYMSVSETMELLKGELNIGLYLTMIGSLGVLAGSTVESFFLMNLRKNHK